ncbi:MAG: hypothetical protein QOD74_301 [Variibacter sp.]|nr:hypothetical protein [Variibacter sp.]
MPPFKSAVAAFTLAASLAAASGAGANDALDFWRQEYERSRGQQQRSYERPQETPRPRLKLTVRPSARDASPDDDASDSRRSAGLGGRVMCVRTCDGFYFPLSASGGDERETCRELCPGTPVEVYRQPSGDDSMDDAVSRNGRRYSQLPAAFLYRKELKAGCECQRGRVAALATLKKDDTLRQGDIVMTEKGVRIFAGGSKFPFRDADFVSLNKARGLPKALASFLSLIDRPFRQSELKESLSISPERPVRTASLLLAR